MPNPSTIAVANARVAVLLGIGCLLALGALAIGGSGQRLPAQSRSDNRVVEIARYQWPTDPVSEDGVISIGEVGGWPVVTDLPKPESMTDQVFAFRRGRDLRRGLPSETLERLAALAKNCDPEADDQRSRLIGAILRGGMVGTGPISPEVPTIRNWPEGLMTETQGFGSEDSRADAPLVSGANVQEVIAASSVYGTLRCEAAAVRLDGRIVILARWWSDDGERLPLVIARRGGAIGVTIGGIWAPLAGVSGAGAAAVRIAPEQPGRAYLPALGPDGVALMGYALDGGSIAGLDQEPGVNAIGGLLLQYASPSSQILMRHSTPGIWLTADRREGWRFEFRSGGGSEQSDGFEFAAIKAAPELARLREPSWSSTEEVDVSRLVADGHFRAPELATTEPERTLLEAELDGLGAGDHSWHRIARWLGSRADGELRVVFDPDGDEVVLADGMGRLIRLRGE